MELLALVLVVLQGQPTQVAEAAAAVEQVALVVLVVAEL
jgi:hypothetical protein